MRNIFKGSATVLLLFACLLAPSLSYSTEGQKPAKTDKCPVCGMFVYKYPDWTARIRLLDGHDLYFDGPKDLFKYYLDPALYGGSPEKIEALYVTEYYGLREMDAREALYVVGSDVLGPMGRELLPFATMDEAREFMRDHKGRAALRFQEVSKDTLQGLQ